MEEVEVPVTKALHPFLKKPSINFQLLPIKLHYFLFFGAIGGVMPYMPVLAKELGINATAYGIISTILPFIVLLAKPAFGALTDHYQNFKLVMILLILATCTFYILVLLIPSIKSSKGYTENRVVFDCTDGSLNITIPTRYNGLCVSSYMEQGLECHFLGDRCLTDQNNSAATYLPGNGKNCENFCKDSFANITIRISNTVIDDVQLKTNFHGTHSSDITRTIAAHLDNNGNTTRKRRSVFQSIEHIWTSFSDAHETTSNSPINVTGVNTDSITVELSVENQHSKLLESSNDDYGVVKEVENIPSYSEVLQSDNGPRFERLVNKIDKSKPSDSLKIPESCGEKCRLYTFTVENTFDIDSICDCVRSNTEIVVCKPSLDFCVTAEKDVPSTSVYLTYQFYLFTLLTIISGTCSATMFCLSDAACYEALGDKPGDFGKQRLWGTISWGLTSLLTGFLNDLSSKGLDRQDYAPGFYLMVCLIFLDLIVISRTNLTKSKFSSSIRKDITKLFSSAEIVAFSVGVFIAGALSGLLWSYQFWYLQNLGATQLLLGITVAVQCLVAEVPFFFISGWMIKTFGHFYCLIGVFAAFSVRYILYSSLSDPWLMLPIEILHVLTFALFYATMTSYAGTKAPPGTEATMLGVLGGLFEGLGVAIGSLLSGLGFDYLSGRLTFLTAGIVSLLCAIAFFIIYWVLTRASRPIPTPETTTTERPAEF